MAAEQAHNGQGFWDGNVFKLRSFVCPQSSGHSKGVEYTQTMGAITIQHKLRPEVASLAASAFIVELSCWELCVRVDGRKDLDEHLSALNGDFQGDIRRDLSWWRLEQSTDGKCVFIIQLAKKEHKAWNGVWKVGMNQHRKTHFGWTPEQTGRITKAEEMLVKIRPGQPDQSSIEAFIINRENLCAGLEEGQDTDTITYRIHFDRAALDKACETTVLSKLFGVDVMDRWFKLFIRGDERSPIMLGELNGRCIPELTKWEIVKAVCPDEQEDDNSQEVQQQALRPHQEGRKLESQTSTSQYLNCLQVIITKDKAHRKHWPEVLNQNTAAIERDAAPLIQEMHAKAVRAPSPDRTNWTAQDHAKESKAKADKCFKGNEWRDAAVYYTRAINHTPDDEKLYSNRSACYSKLKKYDKAIRDAQKCISLKPSWPKAYFRQGVALRGLQRWEEALAAFAEGRFRDPTNPDWAKESDKTEDDRDRFDEQAKEQRRLKREADMTTELNEATVVAEREAMVAVAEQAMRAGKTRKEAGELAVKGAEVAKQRVHDMVKQKQNSMMVEDDNEPDAPAPYRIVKEDGTIHSKGFAHTDKGTYFMGMVVMNSESEPANQPWVEIRHPGKMRWSQGCAQLRLKVTLPESVRNASELNVQLTPTRLFIGTVGDADPIVVGDLERKVEPEGENFSWFLVPDEKPPVLEMTIDKDSSEIYQTFGYGSLLWSRLFNDDIPLGEGLFEADLTDLPPQLLEKFRREQARSNQTSLNERNRRKKMTEEEISEETARNWNEEFARHGMPHRLDTNEDKMIESMRY